MSQSCNRGGLTSLRSTKRQVSKSSYRIKTNRWLLPFLIKSTLNTPLLIQNILKSKRKTRLALKAGKRLDCEHHRYLMTDHPGPSKYHSQDHFPFAGGDSSPTLHDAVPTVLQANSPQVAFLFHILYQITAARDQRHIKFRKFK